MGRTGVRRIVTGLDASGQSAIISDAAAPVVLDVPDVPGLSTHVIWSHDAVPDIASQVTEWDADTSTYYPAPAGTRFLIVTHPAGSGVTIGTSLPGSTAHDVDGVMHRTDTFDLGVILSGTITLGLDDGSRTVLTAGDTIIQAGVRHGWYNTSEEPCVMAFVVLGAQNHQERP